MHRSCPQPAHIGMHIILRIRYLISLSLSFPALSLSLSGPRDPFAEHGFDCCDHNAGTVHLVPFPRNSTAAMAPKKEGWGRKRKAAPGSPEAEQEMDRALEASGVESQSQMLCGKCATPVTMPTSAQNGRDPLNRDCHGCAATCAWIKAGAKGGRSPAKANQTPNEVLADIFNDQSAAPEAGSGSKQQHCKNLQAWLKVAPAEKKQEWYKQQKNARDEEKRNGRRRTFAYSKGYVQEEKESSRTISDREGYTKFEWWASPKIITGKLIVGDKGPNNAADAWNAALELPGNKKYFSQGEWWLKEAKGLHISNDTKSSVISGTKVSQQLDDEQDLDHHAQISDSTHARFRSDQEASLTSHQGLASSPAAPTIKGDSRIDGLDPLALSAGSDAGILRKTVEKEFKKRREEEGVREERLLQEAIAVCAENEQRAQAKVEKTEKEERIACVQNINLGTAIANAKADINSVLNNLKKEREAARFEIEAKFGDLEEAQRAGPKKDFETRVQLFDATLPLLEAAGKIILDTATEIQKKDSEDGDLVYEAIQALASSIKHWKKGVKEDGKTKDDSAPVKATRNALEKVKGFKKVLKKAIEDANAAAQKASTVAADTSATSPLEEVLVKEGFHPGKDGLSEAPVNVAWSVDTNIFKAGKSAQKAVFLPEERIKAVAEKVNALEYWKDIQLHSAKRMKELKSTATMTGVSRPQVVRGIKTAVYALSEIIPATKDPKSKVAEVYGPQFYFEKLGHSAITVTTDHALIDCRIALMGSSHVYGLDMDNISGDTLKTKYDALKNMSKKEFHEAVQQHGFHYYLKPMHAIVIPPRSAVVSIAMEDLGGLKWVIDGPTSCMKVSLQVLNEPLRDYESLKGTTHEILQKEPESGLPSA